MTAKQIKEAKRALTMLAFAQARVPDFTHAPAKPADAKHAATIVKCEQAITDLGGQKAIQQANVFGERSEEQQTDRGDVEAALRRVNVTVTAIAEETRQPALMDRFRMPHGHGDTELAGKLRGFATAMEELSLTAALTDHGLTETPAGLRALAEGLAHGAGEQGLALSDQAGATASIPVTLKKLRECKKTFEALYQNTYADNTAMLAAWMTASHVERTNPKTTPPPTPTPTGAAPGPAAAGGTDGR